MRNNILLIPAFLLLFFNLTYSQVKSNFQTPVSINDDGTDPAADAIFDIQSLTKGLLIPRMTETEKGAMSVTSEGLLVYQNDGTKGFYYFDGTKWVLIGSGDKLTEAEVDAYVDNNGYLTSEVDGSTTNEIQDLSLTGNMLTITNNGAATTIDLSTYLDNTDTQLSEAEVDAFVDNNGYLITEVDGSTTNEIQDLSLTGDDLTITNNGNATSIDLSTYLDNTDTQLSEAEVDAFVDNNGYLTTEVDGSTTNEIQSLSFNNTSLTLSDANTVNLSSLKVIDIVQDGDGDTKIQVEESNEDEDKIRFDIGGTEYYRMEAGKLRLSNAGISIIIGNNAGNNDDLSNNENIFMGYYAGHQNVNSAAGVGIGRAAMEKHTSGNFSVALGNYSLQKHETGSNNVAIGAYSINNSIDGEGNTALGTGALRFDTTGNNNVAIGSFCLYNGQDVSGTVAVGNNAGYNATGDNNVFLGKSAGYSSSESNVLYIDNSNTSSPLVYGEFNNNLLRVNGTLNSTGEISGNTSLDIGTTGLIGNLSVGSESTDQGTSNHTGDGFLATPWVYTNAVEAQGERGSASTLITIGNDGTHGGDDRIHFVTSGDSRMMIASNGRVGLDQSSPDSDLHIRQSQQSIAGGTGGITFEDSSDPTDTWRIYHSGIYFSFNTAGDRVSYINNSTGAYVTTSDRKFKKNIDALGSVLDKVRQLRPVSYHYNRQANSEQKISGFIAQEVEPLFPELVSTGEDGAKGIAYGMTGPIVVKAIQEQQDIIDAQQEEIEGLKAENKQLLQRMERIEQHLGIKEK